MSRVASEPSPAKPHLHGVGARWQSPDTAAKPNPFNALLSGSSETPPPPRNPHGPPDRTPPGSAARNADTPRNDPPHITRGRQPDAKKSADEADSQQQAAPDDPKVEDSAGDEKAANTEPIEATLLSAVTDDPTVRPPVVSIQPIAAALPAPALPDAKTVEGATADGVDLAAAGTDVAAAGADFAAAGGATTTDGVLGAQAKGAATSKGNASGNSGSADAAGSKTAGKARATRSDATTTASADDANQGNGEEQAGSKGKSERAHLRLVAASNQDAAAQKPGETATRQRNEDPPAVDGGKPLVDVAQIARPPHPADHFGNFTAHAAQTAQAGTAANAASGATVPVAGIAIEIAARAQAGRNRFEIRLDPPELGRIDVRLDVDRSGHVTSRLVVEKAETLDLLRRDAPELERALQQAGLKTSDNGLQFALRDQTFAGRDDSQSARSAAKLVVADADSGLVETLAGGYGRLLGRDGGIDIRV